MASALEGLSVLAGGSRDKFVPNTPSRLRAARTCYDHMAGAVGVSLHDRFKALGWLSAVPEAATIIRRYPWMERRRLRLLALTSRQPGGCGAGSRTPAWIGASGGLMSAGHWGRLC